MDTMTYLSQLKPIENIIDKIEIPTLFGDDRDDCVLNCIEHLYSYCESNPKIFCKDDYHQELCDSVDQYIDVVFENLKDYDYEDEIDDFKNDVFKQFYLIVPKRSKKGNPVIYDMSSNYNKHITNILDFIEEKDKVQPEQRTKEWFEQRHNLLSASTIWKAIDKQNYKNSLIFEKCEPIDPEKYNKVSINTPFHHGQKYEPVAQGYYEYKYDATIKEYGCIPHTKYKFLGASPDGINIKNTSKRYGRMLEIKCPTTREITGIPKKEYWIQTQLQMECCDLEECDFLECSFKEYDDEEEADKDGTFQYTKDNKYKGVIVQFYHNTKPYYEYAPFNISKEYYDKWYEEIMEDNSDKTWVKNIYWRLENVSCVLIQRNRLWFNNVVDEMSELWDTIVKERISGYQHRKPAKRVRKTTKNESKENSILNILSQQLKKSSKEEKIIVINT